ncbi:MAG: hypothetical protein KF902_14125 [Phycisphaeraceae bacterium]|nr:hypothetical protein [Phycisphaeraceae bacterium]
MSGSFTAPARACEPTWARPHPSESPSTTGGSIVVKHSLDVQTAAEVSQEVARATPSNAVLRKWASNASSKPSESWFHESGDLFGPSDE